MYFEDKPDVNHADPNLMADEIRDAKRGCDFLIVSCHWGTEFDF